MLGNLPQLDLERNLRCKHIMQLCDLSMHVEIVVYLAKQKNENTRVRICVCCRSRRAAASRKRTFLDTLVFGFIYICSCHVELDEVWNFLGIGFWR